MSTKKIKNEKPKYFKTSELTKRYGRSARTILRWQEETHENPFPKPISRGRSTESIYLIDQVIAWENRGGLSGQKAA